MKKISILAVLLFNLICVYAFPVLGIGADIGFTQDFMHISSMQFNADIRLKVAEDFEIRSPVTYTYSNDSFILDAGVSLVYYPFEKGPYFSVSAIQFAYFEKTFLAMNEVCAGWTFQLFNSGFFAEPELCIRDPSATYTDEYSNLRGYFPSYSSFRFRCKIGYKFFLKE